MVEARGHTELSRTSADTALYRAAPAQFPASYTMVFALASRTLRSSSLRPALSLAGARRGYAEAVSDKLKLSFVLPHEVRCY